MARTYDGDCSQRSIAVLKHGSRVAAEDLHERSLAAQLSEGLGDFRVLLVAFDVDVEVVLPLAGARGAGLEPRHVDAGLGEGRDQLEQRPWTIVRGHDHRRPVLARWAGLLRPQHQETRAVLGIVLDRLREELQAGALGRDRWS